LPRSRGGYLKGGTEMREMLMTVSVLDWDESGAKETPAIVVNWDEGEDGDIETRVDSSLFLLAYGTSREDIEYKAVPESNEAAKKAWRAAQSIFSWRPSDENERTLWQAAHDKHIQEEGDEPPIFLHDLRQSVH
jgi:hypothetical protein